MDYSHQRPNFLNLLSDVLDHSINTRATWNYSLQQKHTAYFFVFEKSLDVQRHIHLIEAFESGAFCYGRSDLRFSRVFCFKKSSTFGYHRSTFKFWVVQFLECFLSFDVVDVLAKAGTWTGIFSLVDKGTQLSRLNGNLTRNRTGSSVFPCCSCKVNCQHITVWIYLALLSSRSSIFRDWCWYFWVVLAPEIGWLWIILFCPKSNPEYVVNMVE